MKKSRAKPSRVRGSVPPPENNLFDRRFPVALPEKKPGPPRGGQRRRRSPSPTPSDPPPSIEARLTAAMRAADLALVVAGGSTLHFVREYLVPALEAAGLAVVSKETP